MRLWGPSFGPPNDGVPDVTATLQAEALADAAAFGNDFAKLSRQTEATQGRLRDALVLEGYTDAQILGLWRSESS